MYIIQHCDDVLNCCKWENLYNCLMPNT